ncbi:unnamed protein product [Discosporangium mesarthrocarpum]
MSTSHSCCTYPFPCSGRGETAGELDFNTLSLAYPPRYSPPYVLMNNWSPPPGERPDLPFKVERTKSNLFPVYRATKNGGTRTKTVVRRASGDIEVLIKELSKVCGGKEIEIRGGTLQINGDHHEDVRRWLAGLGF